MFRRQFATSSSGSHGRCPTVLWACTIVLCLQGCMGPAIPARPASQPMVRNAAFPAPPKDPPGRADAARELGPAVAASMPETKREAPALSDPGAKALIDSMLASIDHRTSSEVIISLQPLRNQSKTSSGEFESLRERLAELLSDAAKNSGARFTANDNEAAAYEVQGAAYLATVDGVDMWELYLNLSPTKNYWSIWQTNGPVRVLRRPRPNQPQIFFSQ